MHEGDFNKRNKNEYINGILNEMSILYVDDIMERF